MLECALTTRPVRESLGGKCEGNRLLLLKTCFFKKKKNLLITNTVYVIDRRRDRQDVTVTKATCDADC